jgi:hypothetical protein
VYIKNLHILVYMEGGGGAEENIWTAGGWRKLYNS